MSKRVIISPTEAADRLAIRELVEECPHCADRRHAKGQMAPFTEDARLYAERRLFVDWSEERPLS